jgi:hypothetical protein
MTLKKNKFKFNITKNGRPPHFDTPEDLENKCFEYFQQCILEGEKASITGMTLFVGFSSRASWDDYAKKEEFRYIVKRAKLTVEHSYEMSGTSFDIFLLKNMGWSDKTEVESTNINVNREVTKEDLQKANEALGDLEKDFLK